MQSSPRYHKYALRLLHLYPQAWRERYADEAVAILEERPATLRTLCDLVLGMVDARLHGQLLAERNVLMQQRVRNSQVAIFCSFLLFALTWLASNFFYNLFWTSNQLEPGLYPGLSQIHSNLTQVTLNICGFSAVLVMSIGALMWLPGIIRQAFTHRRRGVITVFLLWLAGAVLTISLLILDTVGYPVRFQMIDNARNLPWLLLGHPHWAASTIQTDPLTLFVLLLFAWVFVAGPICLLAGTRKSVLAPLQPRVVSIAALLVIVAMSVMLVAMGYLALGLHIYAPGFITGRIIALNVGVLWMALLTIVAYGALWRGWRAQRILRPAL